MHTPTTNTHEHLLTRPSPGRTPHAAPQPRRPTLLQSAVESQMKAIARPMYSNPPLHGALLVSKILHCKDLKAQWYVEVKGMADRIISMRKLLRENLENLGSKWTWNHVTDQIGMFAFSGITPEMVDRLAAEYSIYMTRNGRISMAGVNSKSVVPLAKALHAVTKSEKQ